MTEVGRRLKEERERRGLSIADIAQITKIQEKYLQALEEGTDIIFPSSGHALAFLHKYCALLELPEKQLVELFKSELYPVTATVKAKDAFVHPISQHGVQITTRQVIILGVVIFALVVIFSMFSQLHALLIAPSLSIFAPQAGETVEGTYVIVEGRTTSDAKMSINDRWVEVAEDGYFKEKVELSDEKNQTIIFKSVNKISKAITEVRRTIRVNPVSDISEDTPTPSSFSQLSLRVRVTEDTVLSIGRDDQVEEILLPKDTIKNFTAEKKITLRSVKAHVTYISFQGGAEEQMGGRGPSTKVWGASTQP